MPGEVPAREKIAQLKRYQTQNKGSLDGPEGAWHIEIDGHGALLQKALPQVAPLPAVDEVSTKQRRPIERQEPAVEPQEDGVLRRAEDGEPID